MNKTSKIKTHPVAYSAIAIIVSSFIVIAAMFPLGYLASFLGMSFDSPVTEHLLDGLTRLAATALVLLATYFWLDKKYNYQFNKKNLLKWSPVFIPSLMMFAVTMGLVLNLKTDGRTEIIVPASVVLICVFEAACVGFYEEITFRGLFCQSLLKSGKKNAIKKAVFITMIFFGLIHFTGGLTQVLNATFSGLFMVSIYIRSKNIWVPITHHAIWNSGVFILATKISSGESLLTYAYSKISDVNSLGVSGVFAALVGALTFVFPVFFLCCALFLVRKSKHAEIKELWGLAENIQVKKPKKITN